MIFEQFSNFGIIPVVVFDDVKDVAPLAKILSENNLQCIEVAFRTPVADEAVRIITREFPDMLVGACNILNISQAELAINAGAKFIVTCGINPDIVQYCLDESIPVTPGTQTPTEIEQALGLSLTVVNYFPAEPVGGLKMIKALASVYEELKFMPSGGINVTNLRDYLAYDRVVACAGSWLTARELIKANNWKKISELVKEAVNIVKEVRS